MSSLTIEATSMTELVLSVVECEAENLMIGDRMMKVPWTRGFAEVLASRMGNPYDWEELTAFAMNASTSPGFNVPHFDSHPRWATGPLPDVCRVGHSPTPTPHNRVVSNPQMADFKNATQKCVFVRMGQQNLKSPLAVGGKMLTLSELSYKLRGLFAMLVGVNADQIFFVGSNAAVSYNIGAAFLPEFSGTRDEKGKFSNPYLEPSGYEVQGYLLQMSVEALRDILTTILSPQFEYAKKLFAPGFSCENLRFEVREPVQPGLFIPLFAAEVACLREQRPAGSVEAMEACMRHYAEAYRVPCNRPGGNYKALYNLAASFSVDQSSRGSETVRSKIVVDPETGNAMTEKQMKQKSPAGVPFPVGSEAILRRIGQPDKYCYVRDLPEVDGVRGQFAVVNVVAGKWGGVNGAGETDTDVVCSVEFLHPMKDATVHNGVRLLPSNHPSFRNVSPFDDDLTPRKLGEFRLKDPVVVNLTSGRKEGWIVKACLPQVNSRGNPIKYKVLVILDGELKVRKMHPSKVSLKSDSSTQLLGRFNAVDNRAETTMSEFEVDDAVTVHTKRGVKEGIVISVDSSKVTSSGKTLRGKVEVSLAGENVYRRFHPDKVRKLIRKGLKRKPGKNKAPSPKRPKDITAAVASELANVGASDAHTPKKPTKRRVATTPTTLPK